MQENSESPEQPPEFEITITYDEFLTRFDIDEILSSIDAIIDEEIFFGSSLPRQSSFPAPMGKLSYLGITSVGSGSITIISIVSTAVAAYVIRRFKKGLDSSSLDTELKRFGEIVGDRLSDRIVKRVNDWIEEYIPKQRALDGKVKAIRIKQRAKKGQATKALKDRISDRE